ncbi:MAG: hypothetical protein COA96_16025 [SAR86 cluster bacterium]|uniref:Thiol:disulfide interchange protein n=1 Tax=SAR86 cluster bacterium TaxID=2030880 RepID=A0A2A5AKZ8_9GAMM|nr:MAG: hypothetical protein COA96_16025 [SAR86 cluster bacterium]
MRIRTLLVSSLFVMFSAVFATSAIAQADKYIAGTHYTILENPVRTADDSKIEVTEIFWYGCPACFNFEPLLNGWVKNQAEDVNFIRFPGIFNGLMKIHAQVFYTAQNMGVSELVHDSIFDNLVVQRRQLQTADQVAALFAKQDINREETVAAFNSFSVKTKTNQAEKLTNDYRPRGTPSMVVNGKYSISIGGAVTGQREMLSIVDFLIEKERSS